MQNDLTTTPIADPAPPVVDPAVQAITDPAVTDGVTSAPSTAPVPDVSTAGAVTLSADQFAQLLAAAKAGSGSTSPVAGVPVVRLTADEVPKVGSVVRDAHNRPALVLEVLETTRVERDGTSWTQYVCHVGSFTESRFLDAEELGAL